MSQGQDDQVLMDYLATLLMDDEDGQPQSADGKSAQAAFIDEQFPMTCLSAQVAGATILVPINQVAGMQALAGPLFLADAWHGLPAYRLNQYGQMPLLDVTSIIQQPLSDYLDSAWRGHLLKLKGLEVGLLVDAILGPVQQATAPEMAQVRGFDWGDVGALCDDNQWLLGNFKG